MLHQIPFCYPRCGDHTLFRFHQNPLKASITGYSLCYLHQSYVSLIQNYCTVTYIANSLIVRVKYAVAKFDNRNFH